MTHSLVHFHCLFSGRCALVSHFSVDILDRYEESLEVEAYLPVLRGVAPRLFRFSRFPAASFLN
jgi:hypothetical protein